MVKFLIHKPVAVIMVFIALLLLGVIAAEQIPVSPLPDVDIPEIAVHVSKDNTPARELENTVVKRLRVQLLQVAGLDDIHSETRDDYSIIRLRFDYGTDINYAFLEVNEKIDLSMNSMPADMERPKVVKSSAAELPVFYINLSLKEAGHSAGSVSRFIELSGFAEQVVKRRLEQLPEISFVDMTGVSYPEVYIIPDRAAMAALNLKDEDFKQILGNNNLASGNVHAKDGELEYNIRFASNSLVSVDDIRNIRFKYSGRIFRLSDIARIGIRQKESPGTFISRNRPAINLAVIKQPDTKMEDLRDKTKKLLASLEKRYPDIRFEQTRDQTALLDYSIRNLKQDLYVGSLLAFILMFFFLRNLRAPVLIGITIPVSLILSILFFKLLGITINIISLSGLVLGVGLMIDNSIIVIDNITQYREHNFDLSSACVKGTNEIIRPLISSALTTCSVFLPLIFLSGIAGALFYDQAMAITIGLTVSLLVSITLLPTLYRQFHRGRVHSGETAFFEKFGISFFERIYESGFHWVFSNKLSALLIVITLILSNIFLFNRLKKEKLPAFEETGQVAEIDWNQNINTDENKRRVMELVDAVNKDLIQSSGLIGQQQYLLNRDKELSSSEAVVYLKVKDPRALEVIKRRMVLFLLKHYPEAAIRLNPPPTIFQKVFGEDEPELLVRLSETGDGKLPSKAEVEKIRDQLNLKFASSNIPPPVWQENMVLKLDPEKLLVYDVPVESVYNRLKSALNENQVGSLRDGGQQVPVVVTGNQNYLDSVIQNVTVINKRGIAIPVSGLLTTEGEETYKTIEGGKSGNFVPLAVETGQPEQVMKYINTNIRGGDMDISFAGSYFSNKQLIKEMAVVLAVSVLLLYFILAAQFESLVQPLIVLFELPISMSGALIMLYLFGSSINLISLIGLVVICGIVINDSILKIDTINELRRNQGYELIEAIHAGGVRRLKSIIMTSMTTILSVLPFMFGNDMGSVLQRPLSLALIGGMLIGTPVSLYFIPLVYWFYYHRFEKKNMSDEHGNELPVLSGEFTQVSSK